MTPRAATVSSALVAALQAALAGEHAAVWAHGRAAAELSSSERNRVLDRLDEHRAARDALRIRILAARATPVPAAAAYVEPFPVTGARTARRLLGHVEEALVATYADLAAGSARGERTSAVNAAVAAGGWAVAWGAPSSAFPGAG